MHAIQVELKRKQFGEGVIWIVNRAVARYLTRNLKSAIIPRGTESVNQPKFVSNDKPMEENKIF